MPGSCARTATCRHCGLTRSTEALTQTDEGWACSEGTAWCVEWAAKVAEAMKRGVV